MAESALSSDAKLWRGGGSPFKVEYGKVMMWYFLLSDSFTFAALLITYGSLRFSHGHDIWPEPAKVFEGWLFVLRYGAVATGAGRGFEYLPEYDSSGFWGKDALLGDERFVI